MFPIKPRSLGFTAPARLAPQWYVGYLLYQGGNPRIRIGSLTGGGQMISRPLAATFQPVIVDYTTTTLSAAGGGQVIARPGFLTGLLGGAQGNGS